MGFQILKILKNSGIFIKTLSELNQMSHQFQTFQVKYYGGITSGGMKYEGSSITSQEEIANF